MSFILDALRKSEHERQRSAVPGLSHVPLATPRRELPGWALLVIGVLAAAVLVLGGAWWQSQRSLGAPAASVAGRRSRASRFDSADRLRLPRQSRRLRSRLRRRPQRRRPPRSPHRPCSSPRSLPPHRRRIPSPPPHSTSRPSRSRAPPSCRSDAAPAGPTLPSAASLQAQGINVPPLQSRAARLQRQAGRTIRVHQRPQVQGRRAAHRRPRSREDRAERRRAERAGPAVPADARVVSSPRAVARSTPRRRCADR